jgi:hypothetical protein
MAFDRGAPAQQDNGDEGAYPTRIATYSKGLQHDALGEVAPASFASLLAALESGAPADFEAILLGGPRPLTNPMAGLAFDLEGPDSHACFQPPAPRFASAEAAGEAVELYWMALARDVAFGDYPSDPVAQSAAANLAALTDFSGPSDAAHLFRGFTPGDLAGPYVSQFLMHPVPFGALEIDQRMETVPAGIDYLTDFGPWLNAQNGAAVPGYPRDPVRRYIRNLRDLAQWVHVDALYQAYLDACLILLAEGAPFSPGNPYAGSQTQVGFGTFGGPHILSLVTEVATRALKCVWYQKWFVHRRLRPEEFGGRVHAHRTGMATYPLHTDILGSPALDAVESKYGTFLLPQAFPEGSPTHPSYGAGHATVAGACVTILKAWFDEAHALQDPLVPTADGTALVPYAGPDAGNLTVGGELNKLAANIAIGRNGAGVHWRSDYTESVRLGEEIAIDILQEQKLTYAERPAFAFTRFDGSPVTV